MVVKKRKYIPDLTEYMTQCEVNYALIMRLFRVHEQIQEAANLSRERSLPAWMVLDDGAHRISLPFKVTILDDARYTTTLQLNVKITESDWVEPIALKVRLYHDAQMAEVLVNNRNHTPDVKHDYPEQVKLYPDDKFQRNQLLNQCLKCCFSHSTDTVTLPIIKNALT